MNSSICPHNGFFSFSRSSAIHQQQLTLSRSLHSLTSLGHRFPHQQQQQVRKIRASVEGSKKNAIRGNGGGLQGMAEAFDIRTRTATGITLGICTVALAAPLAMVPLAVGSALKTKYLSYLTLLCGFYMAWNIGANDVANAMGTSVGSGALTLRQAVLTAGILEFSGAFMVGSHVTQTMQNILVPGTFAGKDSLLFVGLISSLAAAGSWLQVASYFGWPVSTTHCIIGSLVGFGLAYGGVEAVYWTSLARVVSSWFISPLLGALVSCIIYKCIRTFVYSAPQPGLAAARAAPIAVFIGVAAFSLTVLPSTTPLLLALEAISCGSTAAIVISFIIRKQLSYLIGESCSIESPDHRRISFTDPIEGPTGTQLTLVYAVFGYLQVLSACFMSFAHGANDVSNAIGPISAALSILHGSSLDNTSSTIQVLAWGGFGIVAGLVIWGYRVIATIGKKITELTPTRGFAAEFAAASVVVGASRLGLPISATHTLVGAVMGVGFARGFGSVRVETVREIVASWLVTIPVGASLTLVYTFLLRRLVTSL